MVGNRLEMFSTVNIKYEFSGGSSRIFNSALAALIVRLSALLIKITFLPPIECELNSTNFFTFLMDSIDIFFEAPSSDSLSMTLRFGCSVDSHCQSWHLPQACI